MSKNAGRIPHGGVHSVPTERTLAAANVCGGRPEPERGTPVNMENELHRDNGEGVAATPLPYPPMFGDVIGSVGLSPSTGAVSLSHS